MTSKLQLISNVLTTKRYGAFAVFTPSYPHVLPPLAVILGAIGGSSLFPM